MNLNEAIAKCNREHADARGESRLTATTRQASKWRSGYGAAWCAAHDIPFKLHIPVLKKRTSR